MLKIADLTLSVVGRTPATAAPINGRPRDVPPDILIERDLRGGIVKPAML
jgi:hypothetical protein